VEELKSAITLHGLIGLNTDMWPEVKNRHYVSLTVHFIDQSQLHSRVLTVNQFQQTSKTGQNIRENIINECSKLGISLEVLMKKWCLWLIRVAIWNMIWPIFKIPLCLPHACFKTCSAVRQVEQFSFAYDRESCRDGYGK